MSVLEDKSGAMFRNFMERILKTYKGRIEVTKRPLSSCYSLFVDTSDDSSPYWCRKRSSTNTTKGTLCGNDEEITDGGYIGISTPANLVCFILSVTNSSFWTLESKPSQWMYLQTPVPAVLKLTPASL